MISNNNIFGSIKGKMSNNHFVVFLIDLKFEMLKYLDGSLLTACGILFAVSTHDEDSSNNNVVVSDLNTPQPE